MRCVRTDLEGHEVAVRRPAAVAAAEVVARHKQVTPACSPLCLAVSSTTGRPQIPVAAMVGAAGDGDVNPRAMSQLVWIPHDGPAMATGSDVAPDGSADVTSMPMSARTSVTKRRPRNGKSGNSSI